MPPISDAGNTDMPGEDVGLTCKTFPDTPSHGRALAGDLSPTLTTQTKFGGGAPAERRCPGQAC